MSINSSAGIFDWGPTGRYYRVNASGQIEATSEVAGGIYPLGYGRTGRAVCVDASGRLAVYLVNGGGGSSTATLQSAFNAGSVIRITGSDPILVYQSGTAEAFKIDSIVDQETSATIYAGQVAKNQEDGSANTGTDESYDNTWEAIKFTASASSEVRSVGVRLKRTGTITNVTETITGYIYSDNAGSPNAALGSSNTSIRFGSLTTSYVEHSFFVGSVSLVSGTDYWIIIKRSNAPVNGTIEIDGTNVGTAQHAYSSNGSAWTTENSKQGWHKLYGRTYYSVSAFSTNNYALYGESVNAHGIYGKSTNEYGVYGYSINSFGLRGKSDYNIGIYGSSIYMAGINGVSVSNHGVRGDSTSAAGVLGMSSSLYGVWGTSTSSYGVYGTSTNSAGVYGSSTNSVGIYGYSTNGSAAVYGWATAGQVAHFMRSTHGDAATLKEILRLERTDTAAIASSGIGGGIDYYIENTNGDSELSGRVSVSLVDPTDGTETSRMAFWVRNAGGSLTERLTLKEDGTLLGNNSTWNVDATGNATFASVTSAAGSYKENIATDGWTDNGDGRYYRDLAHSLGTNDILAQFYDSSTMENVMLDTIDRTSVNNIRVYASVSGLALRALLLVV